MIIGFIGKQRSGKTLTMNNLAKVYQSMGYLVVTNQKEVSYPHTYFDPSFLVDKKGIEDLKRKTNNKKIIMCLDEAHLWLDSRRSKNNTAKSFLITQAAKLMEEEGHFFYTTQFFGSIDIRLRYNTSYVFHFEKEENDAGITFRMKVLEPRGEYMHEIKEVSFDSSELFDNNLYNRFEMIDVED